MSGSYDPKRHTTTMLGVEASSRNKGIMRTLLLALCIFASCFLYINMYKNSNNSNNSNLNLNLNSNSASLSLRTGNRNLDVSSMRVQEKTQKEEEYLEHSNSNSNSERTLMATDSLANSIFQFAVDAIDGSGQISLETYRGAKAYLVVNVASK